MENEIKDEIKVDKLLDLIKDNENLKTEIDSIKKTNEFLEIQIRNLRDDVSDANRERSDNMSEIADLESKITNLESKAIILEDKRLKEKYIKLVDISKTLLSLAFDDIITIKERVPIGRDKRLELFDMK